MYETSNVELRSQTSSVGCRTDTARIEVHVRSSTSSSRRPMVRPCWPSAGSTSRIPCGSTANSSRSAAGCWTRLSTAPMNLRVGAPELLDGRRGVLARRHLGADDEQHAAGAMCATSAASVTGMTGGASMMIQSYFLRSSASSSSYLFEPSSSAGFGGMWPAGSSVRFGTDGRPRGVGERRVADEHVRQSRLLRAAERLVHARPAHVGVDDERLLTGLRERDRQTARDHRLAFVRARARDDERPAALVGRREQDRGAQRPDRFRERRRHAVLRASAPRPPLPSATRPEPCRGTAGRGAP